MSAAQTSTVSPGGQQKTGGVAKGALGGLLMGAAIGDDSESAGRGMVVGGLLGGVRQSRHNQQYQAQRQHEQAMRYQQHRNNYNRAYSACLEGRGYTVK